MPADESAAYTFKLTVSLSALPIAACNEAPIPQGHPVIPAGDDVHDQMDPTTTVNALVHAHQNNAQPLAEALVSAAQDGLEVEQPYRDDDATTTVIRSLPAPPGIWCCDRKGHSTSRALGRPPSVTGRAASRPSRRRRRVIPMGRCAGRWISKTLAKPDFAPEVPCRKTARLASTFRVRPPRGRRSFWRP
ncbi:hypothetical protein ACFXEL_25890 [Streptomyces sp. NPDC059382]|uniref:hypothetical protein n=1 Tax=Streptomyces sp. NPDC059382 TaxID=3346816 RepID=UPI0036B013FA